MAAGDEPVEVIDEDGTVIDVLPRREIRARNLRHRCTYVSVLTSDRQLVVHRRADWKDVYPSYWDLCFGGVCDVGEPWLEAATRELAEEAGVRGVDLTELGPVAYDGPDGRLIGRVYVTTYDGELHCDDGEVVEVDRIPIEEAERWVGERDVCPDSAQLALPLVLAHIPPPTP